MSDIATYMSEIVHSYVCIPKPIIHRIKSNTFSQIITNTIYQSMYEAFYSTPYLSRITKTHLTVEIEISLSMPQGLMPYNQDYYKNGILFGLKKRNINRTQSNNTCR